MDKRNKYCNIPNTIIDKIGRNLHLQKGHPLHIISNRILDYFLSLKDYDFKVYNNFEPYVHIVENFDKLLILKDHPSRRKSDTYYITPTGI
jgi:phenylalanyl-tRNA synthetase alpha chain